MITSSVPFFLEKLGKNYRYGTFCQEILIKISLQMRVDEFAHLIDRFLPQPLPSLLFLLERESTLFFQIVYFFFSVSSKRPCQLNSYDFK